MTGSKVDLTEFFKYSKPKRRPCPLGFALGQLSEDERIQLNGAVTTDIGIITTAAIQQWLAARNHEASISAITAHRKGMCTCDR